jgi:PAS domain S-box-containing protein
LTIQSIGPKAFTQNSAFDQRAQIIFNGIMAAITRRTDRMFAFLMVGQWLFGIVLALAFSRYTWEGKVYSTHVHVYSALFLGGAISSLPLLLIWLKPGAPITRYTVAAAQMLWSALLIHLTGGRIETHFHVFGSLAFLAVYRDIRVLAPATIVVAADHFLRGILWPESVYGIVNPEWWRFLEHAFWVAFENVFLIMSIRDSRRGSLAIARRQVELEEVNAGVEAQVQQRTSELAASREQYRSLLETTLAIPWELDLASARFTYVGPQSASILGYPLDAWLDEGFLRAHTHPDDQSAIVDLIDMAPGGKAEVEFRLKAADGRWIWVRNIVSVPDDANARRVLRGIMLDVTGRKKLEAELAQAQKLESVGRLAAGIAHEINTPIQFVSDSIHFLRDGTDDLSRLIAHYRALHQASSSGIPPEELARITRVEQEVDLAYLLEKMPTALDRAQDGLQRVADIVRSMKEFAHPDQKEKAAADLNQSIASTLTIARNEYKYVADLETAFGDLPPVTCHIGEVNQAVLNIVVNAAHAISDHPNAFDLRGRIDVRTWQESGQVVIAISDTGGGIPQDIRDNIFDPFFTTKPVGRGTGQGLAIARSAIVDKHGGTIAFETEEGHGTTFFIRLPIDGNSSSSTEAA